MANMGPPKTRRSAQITTRFALAINTDNDNSRPTNPMLTKDTFIDFINIDSHRRFWMLHERARRSIITWITNHQSTFSSWSEDIRMVRPSFFSRQFLTSDERTRTEHEYLQLKALDVLPTGVDDISLGPMTSSSPPAPSVPSTISSHHPPSDPSITPSHQPSDTHPSSLPLRTNGLMIDIKRDVAEIKRWLSRNEDGLQKHGFYIVEVRKAVARLVKLVDRLAAVDDVKTMPQPQQSRQSQGLHKDPRKTDSKARITGGKIPGNNLSAPAPKRVRKKGHTVSLWDASSPPSRPDTPEHTPSQENTTATGQKRFRPVSIAVDIVGAPTRAVSGGTAPGLPPSESATKVDDVVTHTTMRPRQLRTYPTRHPRADTSDRDEDSDDY